MSKTTTTPAPDASNTVLFSMMNFYKRRMEALEQQNASLKKKIRVQYDEYRNELGDLQQQLHDQVDVNHHFAQVNLRNTETIMRKHDAGIRLARCFEELSSAIELVEDTHVGDEAMGLRYIYMKKEEIMQRADVGVRMLVREDVQDDLTRWENEIADNMLVIERNIIDLTEDTEEELSEEESEYEPEEEHPEDVEL